jgi:kynureninase
MEYTADQFDAADALAPLRREFHHPPGVIYLDGNSLGLASHRAEEAIHRVLGEWRTLGIAGWLSASPPWFALTETISGLMAPLVGAAPDEIGIGDSTTINLHKFLAAFYDPSPARPRILIDALAFPTDRYAVQSQLRLHGRDPAHDLVQVASRDGYTLEETDIIAAMTPDVQIAVLPAVLYQSGQLLDIARLARAARARDILLAVDCSHSAGVIPHRLDEWGVDFGFWCTYKYLHGGPGAAAAWYLNRRHFGRHPGLAGWFGNRKERQFDMAAELAPAPDARCLHVGTPHVLSMAALTGTLPLITTAGIDRLRETSLRQTAYLIRVLEDRLGQFGFTLVTPREDERRGGHVALAHPEALRICKALAAAGVVVDHRPPNLVRLGPSPLATSFADCYEAALRLERIMEERAYEAYSTQRDLVS